MESLEDFEHRPVVLVHESARHVNLVVGGDAHEILVEGAVVNRAQADSVGHDCLTALIDVPDDVRRVE
jgi:hypothetical protein